MKRTSRKIALLCGIGVCSMLLFATNEISVNASENNTVEVTGESRSTNLTWYYKEIDGVMYMRLWNHSTQEWVTDWVPAVGYPGE